MSLPPQITIPCQNRWHHISLREFCAGSGAEFENVTIEHGDLFERYCTNMSLCEFHYFSAELGRQTAANVLLPDMGDGPLPVLYLLHGITNDYTAWLRRSNVERYATQYPFIVVMPDGGRGFYADSAAGEKYLSALAVELPQQIERIFPARRDRSGRCVAGLSMGGFGALKFALTFPERYVAAASMSGAVGFGHRDTDVGGEPYSPEFRRILGAEILGGPNDLWALAERVAPDILPALRIDCGVDDYLIDDNRDLHAHLDRAGIPHEYAEYPGAHTWDYWDLHVRDALAFCHRSLHL